MATWVVGDVQGCFEPLQRLLVAIGFDPRCDRLWLAGDLVNRGPDSLGVLLWATQMSRQHPQSVRAVLGNHDLHLLARAARQAGPKRRDTLDDVLRHPQHAKLCRWLASQPLAALLDAPGHPLLIHAGVLPSWTVDFVLGEAEAASALLRGPSKRLLLRAMYDSGLAVPMAVRLAAEFIQVVTRLRCCSPSGDQRGTFSGPPEEAPDGQVPWFDAPRRQSAGHPILFGHWAALGVRRGADWTSLDSGCVWGHQLTALRVDDGSLVHVDAALDRGAAATTKP